MIAVDTEGACLDFSVKQSALENHWNIWIQVAQPMDACDSLDLLGATLTVCLGLGSVSRGRSTVLAECFGCVRCLSAIAHCEKCFVDEASVATRIVAGMLDLSIQTL